MDATLRTQASRSRIGSPLRIPVSRPTSTPVFPQSGNSQRADSSEELLDQIPSRGGPAGSEALRYLRSARCTVARRIMLLSL
jgi:hypothetical protein